MRLVSLQAAAWLACNADSSDHTCISTISVVQFWCIRVTTSDSIYTEQSMRMYFCKAAQQSHSGAMKKSTQDFQKSYLSKAGRSRSFTHMSCVSLPACFICCNSCFGSALLHLVRSSSLKISGVANPMGGLTRSRGVSRGKGGSTSSTTSPLHDITAVAVAWIQNATNTHDAHKCRTHLPVQYAAPLEKKMETSEPISPDHSSSCSLVAGRPASSFAAHSVVAAFALPPPSPAPKQQAN